MSNGDPVPVADLSSATAFMLDPVLPALAPITACQLGEDTEIDPLEMIGRLKALAASIAGGDTSHPETAAVTQATALNVIFSRLAGLAMSDVTSPHFDSCMRLAFRAQHQCLRTYEKLATFRNRPSATPLVAHQVNLAHQQIVNNHGSHPPATTPAPTSPPPPLKPEPLEHPAAPSPAPCSVSAAS